MAPLTYRQHSILRLIAVPLVALMASHVVLSQVFPGQPGYRVPWAYFLTVVTVMLSCWEINLAIFRWLDTLLPFWRNPTLRLIAQILMGGTATLLTFAFVFPMDQRLYTEHWPAEPTILKGIVVCITLATIVNGDYSGASSTSPADCAGGYRKPLPKPCIQAMAYGSYCSLTTHTRFEYHSCM